VTVTMPDGPGVQQAHHLLTVVLDEGVDRDGVRDSMAKAGIQTSFHYPPAHRFRIYDDGSSLPLTEDYARRAITLPLYPSISEEEVGLVGEAISAALGGRGSS
jgi:dTDP-4-amino-4,6-dideoxygalactose transaminase